MSTPEISEFLTGKVDKLTGFTAKQETYLWEAQKDKKNGNTRTG